MATKSKNKTSYWLSFGALAFGILSFMYGYSFIQQLFEQNFYHTNRPIVHLTHILKGGA